MKQTLLQMTQSILSSLNSDEVNSISDTTESLQVAEVIKQTYFNFITRAQLPEHYELMQLTASNDTTQPIIMYKPETMKNIDWIKYFDESEPYTNTAEHDINTDLPDSAHSVDHSPQYKYITILPNQQFLDMVGGININETNVDVLNFSVGGNTYRIPYKDDKQPSYCTIFKDYYIIFDSFDATVDSTLQSSKTMCRGQFSPSWSMVDDFVPELDVGQFPLLLNEAKSLAFLELKQMAHPKAEQESKRQWNSLQKTKSLAEVPSHFDQLPDFGRAGGRHISRFRSFGWR